MILNLILYIFLSWYNARFNIVQFLQSSIDLVFIFHRNRFVPDKNMFLWLIFFLLSLYCFGTHSWPSRPLVFISSLMTLMTISIYFIIYHHDTYLSTIQFHQYLINTNFQRVLNTKFIVPQSKIRDKIIHWLNHCSWIRVSLKQY